MLKISACQLTKPDGCVLNNWFVDVSSGMLIHIDTGEQRRLGEYHLKLLIILIQHADRILPRDELSRLVWDRKIVGNNSLPNAIHALRVALEDNDKHHRIIQTVSKKGYVLDAAYCHFCCQQVKMPPADKNEAFPSSVDNIVTDTTIEHVTLPEEKATIKRVRKSIPQAEKPIITSDNRRKKRFWQMLFLL